MLCILAFFIYDTHSSAQIVELESSDQGRIIPSLSSTSVITTPSAGMIIYQINASKGLYMSDGATWKHLAPDQDASITGSGATSVSGTNLNFHIASTDNVNDADASTI